MHVKIYFYLYHSYSHILYIINEFTNIKLYIVLPTFYLYIGRQLHNSTFDAVPKYWHKRLPIYTALLILIVQRGNAQLSIDVCTLLLFVYNKPKQRALPGGFCWAPATCNHQSPTSAACGSSFNFSLCHVCVTTTAFPMMGVECV